MSERKKQPATVRPSSTTGGTVETHPSFAMISLSRWTSGGGHSFFGSSVEPHAGVSLSIRRGEKHRSLGNYWYHATEEIIEVNMTEAQFSEMITSFNIGGGIPVTLSHISKKTIQDLPDGMIPECPEINERKTVESEFKALMTRCAAEVAKLVETAKTYQDKPTINKADRKVFTDLAHSIQCVIENGLPFIQGQFNEAMDKTVTHAKADVDSYMSNLLRQAGMDSLKEKAAALDIKLLRDDGGDEQLPKVIEG